MNKHIKSIADEATRELPSLIQKYERASNGAFQLRSRLEGELKKLEALRDSAAQEILRHKQNLTHAINHVRPKRLVDRYTKAQRKIPIGF